MNYLDFIKIGQKQRTFYINIYMPVYTSFHLNRNSLDARVYQSKTYFK